METRRRGVFALAVFACCLVNYYFFVGQVTFCIIYWFVRMFAGSWEISLKDFLLLALEAVLGVGMACVLLVPSVLTVLQNPRVDNPPSAGTLFFMTGTSGTSTFSSASSSRRIFPLGPTSRRIPAPSGLLWARGCPCSA